jgi:hypothetical protein
MHSHLVSSQDPAFMTMVWLVEWDGASWVSLLVARHVASVIVGGFQWSHHGGEGEEEEEELLILDEFLSGYEKIINIKSIFKSLS